jgi:riboflavin biosynthesis pyrimidine reductase
LQVARAADGIDLEDLLTQLWARGCRRVFVEGGGITVSAFLQAGLLDRLHIAVAPLLIGEGRRALRLPASDRLAQCLRPSTRVFAMGSDMLYDCDLRAVPAGRANTSS